MFFSTGEVIAGHSPGYTTVADREGLYRNRWKIYRELLEAHWRPYLAGEVGRAEALRALVSALPSEWPPSDP